MSSVLDSLSSSSDGKAVSPAGLPIKEIASPSRTIRPCQLAHAGEACLFG